MTAKNTPTNPPGEPENPTETPPTWAQSAAMQVWVILFLLTLCAAFLKFLVGF